MNESRVLELIFEAVDEINEQLQPTARLPRSRDAVIVGDGGTLDSLAVVNLLAAIEDKLAANGGPPTSLLALIADEDATRKLHTVDAILRTITAEAARS